MAKDLGLVLFEAVVVGIGLVILYEIIKMVMSVKEKSNYIVLFLSGFVFHVLCEYTGVNVWYSLKYCEILKK